MYFDGGRWRSIANCDRSRGWVWEGVGGGGRGGEGGRIGESEMNYM